MGDYKAADRVEVRRGCDACSRSLDEASYELVGNDDNRDVSGAVVCSQCMRRVGETIGEAVARVYAAVRANRAAKAQPSGAAMRVVHDRMVGETAKLTKRPGTIAPAKPALTLAEFRVIAESTVVLPKGWRFVADACGSHLVCWAIDADGAERWAHKFLPNVTADSAAISLQVAQKACALAFAEDSHRGGPKRARAKVAL